LIEKRRRKGGVKENGASEVTRIKTGSVRTELLKGSEALDLYLGFQTTVLEW